MRGIDLKTLLPLYLVIFTGFCGYSLMITLFVPMLMGANGFLAADATTGQRSLVLGILLAVYPLGQFLGSPVLGALSDRYGRKPVLTVSLFIAVAAYLLIALARLDRNWLPDRGPRRIQYRHRAECDLRRGGPR